MHFLLVIERRVSPRWIGGQRRRGGDGGGELGAHVESLAQRRDRSGEDLFGKAFVVGHGDVEDAHAVLAASRVEVLATSLNHADVGLAQWVQELLADIAARMLLDIGEEPAVFLM